MAESADSLLRHAVVAVLVAVLWAYAIFPSWGGWETISLLLGCGFLMLLPFWLLFVTTDEPKPCHCKVNVTVQCTCERRCHD